MAKDTKKAVKHSFKNLKSIKWAEAVKKSFKFSFHPKRWIPFFIIDAAALFMFLMILGGSVSIFSITTIDTATFVMPVLSVGIIWALVSLYVTGAIVHQSWKEKEFKASWNAAWRRYPSLLVTMIITGIVAFVAANIPYVDWFLAAVVAMAFLLVDQFIMVGGQGFSKAISSSLKTFRYKILKVFTAWILSTLLIMIIIAPFTLPLVIAYFYYASLYGYDYALIYAIIFTDQTVLYLGGSVLLIGLSISKVFNLKFLTEIYVQMTKKKFIFF
jgi:hypothetical protein